mmetsp:Transcript_17258/g.37689  ORF Transcript_17258/g.37689 Transcript_17258/m.37689 type:complete len:284 (+) Transcript_17258:1054-1905(+)
MLSAAFTSTSLSGRPASSLPPDKTLPPSRSLRRAWGVWILLLIFGVPPLEPSVIVPTAVALPPLTLRSRGLVSGLIISEKGRPGGEPKPIEFNDVELRECFCCSNRPAAHLIASASPSLAAISTRASKSALLRAAPPSAGTPEIRSNTPCFDRKVATSVSSLATSLRALTLVSFVRRSSLIRRSCALFLGFASSAPADTAASGGAPEAGKGAANALPLDGAGESAPRNMDVRTSLRLVADLDDLLDSSVMGGRGGMPPLPPNAILVLAGGDAISEDATPPSRS